MIPQAARLPTEAGSSCGRACAPTWRYRAAVIPAYAGITADYAGAPNRSGVRVCDNASMSTLSDLSETALLERIASCVCAAGADQTRDGGLAAHNAFHAAGRGRFR